MGEAGREHLLHLACTCYFHSLIADLINGECEEGIWFPPSLAPPSLPTPHPPSLPLSKIAERAAPSKNLRRRSQ